MLTHRTNLLLSAEEHDTLTRLSRENNKTMGELIRHAVKKTYKIKKIDTFQASLARIRKLTKHVNTKGIDYRALVIAGRKYED